MAGTQRTGTQILALARIYAQDNDSNSNYAVSAANALTLLNALLAEWHVHFGAKPKYLGASTTGISFTSGTVSDETSGDPGFSEIISAHPASSDSLSFPVAKELQRVTVEEIIEMLGYDGDTAIAAQASEWTHFAAERSNDNDDTQPGILEKWRIWVYPAINRTRYMTLKVSPYFTDLTAITEVPDLDEGDSHIVARILAWEMARLKREASQSFLDSIIAPVPKEIMQRMYRGAVTANQLPSAVEWRDW